MILLSILWKVYFSAIMKSILFSYYEKYTFQLQHLKTVCDSNEQLCWQHPIFCVLQCPDRDLIFLDDVLGTIITPNGAGAFPDVTPHDIYTLIYTGNSSPTTSESTSHPILLCISSPTTFSLSPPTCSDIHIPDNIVESPILHHWLPLWQSWPLSQLIKFGSILTGRIISS